MWELDGEESWVPKNWCFWTVVLEKTLESPLDCKEIKPVNPKGNQPWIFVGRTDSEAPKLWSPDVKSHHCKRPDAGKDWGQEEEGVTEDKMVGWHHQLNGHEFEQTLGDSETWCAAVHGVTDIWTQLRKWTTIRKIKREDCGWYFLCTHWNTKHFILLHNETKILDCSIDHIFSRSNAQGSYCQ